MIDKSVKVLFKDFERRNPKARNMRNFHMLSFEIANSIKELRATKGLSQRELAKMVETSHPMIVKWENPSYGSYSLKSLIDVAVALDCELEVKFAPKPKSIKEEK